MNKRKLKIVIAIDGGGIRGVFPLMILNHINTLIRANKIADNINKCVDFIAGTSTGAIISAGLIVKENNKYIYSLEELLGLYQIRGPQLFNLANPKHEKSEGLRLVLKRKFKGIQLSDLDLKFAFVSYDIVNSQPFVFGSNKIDLSEVSLSTALAACSAIPGYFPSVHLNGYELIDGIMTAKNPAEIAYEEARSYFPDEPILLLSFGTGKLEGEMFDDMEEEVERVDASLKQKSRKEDNLFYYRFQPEIIDADPKMDNATPENIAALMQDGTSYIQNNKALFEQLIQDWKIKE